MEGATAQATLARRRDWGTAIFAACALAVAVVAWPLSTLSPDVGADAEWVATLYYAAEHGVRFGADLVWTYGPLGFLETPYGAQLYSTGTLPFAWLYGAIVQLLLAATLLAALRRAFPLLAAALLAAAVLALQLEPSLALGFAWCVLLVLRERGDLPAPAGGVPALPAVALPLALGALTGIVVLGKLNQGAELLVLAGVALAATSVRRNGPPFAGAFAAVAAIGWAATGQRLADAWPYVRNSLENFVGFAAAMGRSDPRGWTILAALVLAAVALALAWDLGRGASRRSRWGLLLLCLVYAGFDFKEGFVRQDSLHMSIFFVDMLALLALLLAAARRRAVLLAAMAGAVTAYAAITGVAYVTEALSPWGNARALADQAGTLASPARQQRLLADLRLRLAAHYQVAPQILAAIGREPVMLWPYAYGDIAFAYGLDLRPYLSLEPYNAYTPRIDRLGAEAIAAADGPAWILRSAPSAAPAIDGRHATFEAPRSTLEIFCRFREVAVQEPWQLLQRAPDRCGAPRPLGVVTPRWGRPAAVPAPRRPGALVLVRIEGAGVHGFERLSELALRPSGRWIALDGARYRLVAASAEDGLLIGAPPAADYPAPFEMAPNAASIAVGRDGGQPGGTLRFVFSEVPLRRVRGAAG